MKTFRTLVLAASIAVWLPGQNPAGEEQIWRHFFEWFQSVDPRLDTIQLYRDKLVAEGLSEKEAGERAALIREKLMPLHSLELTALNFDRIYSSSLPLFNKAPNAFLAGVIAGLKPGAALDVEMGQGRNAVFLAAKGWEVTGFDIAEKGLAAARAEAARRGVKITVVKSRYEDFDFGERKWDLVLFSYAWVPLGDAALVKRVRASLKPEGLVVVEAPAEDPLKPVHLREWPPGPMDDINTLVKVWTEGFRILRYEDTEDMCDWRNRKARIVRLLARRWE